MYRLRNLIFSYLFLHLCACNTPAPVSPVDLVDPFIGTDAHGHTFPGATVPFGMIQLSPTNDFKGWDWCAGYHYSDSIIKGFAHTHISGAGLAGLGDILLMPTSGQPQLNPGTEDAPEKGYRSRFTHLKEKASPGYYFVNLNDYNIDVELTATAHTGFHRYTFNTPGKANVIIDPSHHIMEQVSETEVEYVSPTIIRGYKKSSGEAGKRTVYFYAEFSEPFASYGFNENNQSTSESFKQTQNNGKAYVSYEVDQGQQLEVKVALSFVSYDGAKANLLAEGKNKNFDQAHHEAVQRWSDKLSKIIVEGGTKKDQRIFYTGLYHSFISPNIISDVDGHYVVEGKIYHSNQPQYSTFSTWDTFRALHPLFTIIEQKETANFVNSLVSRHFDSKVGLPVWELLGHDNVCMIGYNTVSPLADAVLKDIPGLDPEKVYTAIKAAAMSTAKHSPNYDKNGMVEYLMLGYVPAEINCSVSKTTEQNYYDWCIAQVAQKLGYTKDADTFHQRSIGYRNLYNPASQFLQAKLTTGEWKETDVSQWDDLISNYISGNMWGYSSYIPHDLQGLIKLHGGEQPFSEWLDNIFSDTTVIEGDTHVDISGFIGKYGHGDEPSHHMPYLYNYSGEPWKTQELVRRISTQFYNDAPDGLINNEDLGQMSAWYIFSALGFYPVCPGDMNYIIGSPLFDKVTIHMESGKTFTIIAKNNSAKYSFIKTATLNHKPLNQNFITHQQIMNGGELTFEMSNTPNKKWGTSQEAIPASSVGTISNPNQSITLKPFDADREEVFTSSRLIQLTCNTKDTRIYYTLDGTTPDQNCHLYQTPIKINSTTHLKAIAVKDGLLPSFVYDRMYYAGWKFTELSPQPSITIEKAPEGYGLKDGSQLFDGLIGTNHFADGRWTGWKGNDLIVLLDLGIAKDINTISLGYMVNTSNWIFPPQSITIWSSDNGIDFKKVKHLNTSFNLTPDSKDVLVERSTLQMKNLRTRYLKIKAESYGSLPKWHAGSPNPSWLFIDEILIN